MELLIVALFSLLAHTKAAQWLKTAANPCQNSSIHRPQGKAITSNTLPFLQMWLPAFLVNVTLMAFVLFIRHDSSHIGLIWVQCPPHSFSLPSFTHLTSWERHCLYSCSAEGSVLFKCVFTCRCISLESRTLTDTDSNKRKVLTRQIETELAEIIKNNIIIFWLIHTLFYVSRLAYCILCDS